MAAAAGRARDAGDGKDDDGYIFLLPYILWASHGFISVWAFHGLETCKQLGLKHANSLRVQPSQNDLSDRGRKRDTASRKIGGDVASPQARKIS